MREVLATRDNDYRPYADAYARRSGCTWHGPSLHAVRMTGLVSVVIPARNAEATIVAVLDALAAQRTSTTAEVIVVDDASTDRTVALAQRHSSRPTVVRLAEQHRAAQARNVGVAVARGDLVVFVDADMVLPNHVIDTFAQRADDDLVLLGFRHNLSHDLHKGGTELPEHLPELDRDHRVHWIGRPGRQVHTGVQLDHGVDVRPLDETADLLDLGHGRTFYDWDLPRMVVTCLLAVPRRRIVEVGGFHPGFTGWGGEDTYLGAALVTAGLKVAPLRQVVGYHLDPPDAESLWPAKLAFWRTNTELYHRLLDQPPESAGPSAFANRTAPLLRDVEVSP